MDIGTKFKHLKFPSFFTSSCKTQNLDEVIDHSKKNSNFTPQNSTFLHSPLLEKVHDNNVDENDEEEDEEKENYPFNNSVIKQKPGKLNSFLSNQTNHHSSSSTNSMMCKPRCPETFDQMVRESCIIATAGRNFNRRKVAGRYALLSPPSGDFSGRRCPPTSPASPLFSKQGRCRKKKQKEKITRFQNNIKNGFKTNPFSFSSSNETDDNGDWFSSDDEREDVEDVYDSDNVDHQAQTQTQTRTQKRPMRRKRVGPRPKDTFAVVKSSSDPYNDFRTSMVEMIIEKQIFGAKELEQLLKCFLSLNSIHHHEVIVRVFNEICDVLFSHSSRMNE